jgi:microcystin-dependent protein
MATLLPVPKARFFDASGAPLAGGKAYFYEAGTTTPKATYTDYSGTVPNANPVILDSQGYANIWLGTSLYKIVLTDANDVQIYTVDNIGQPDMSGQTTGFGAAEDVASANVVDLGSVDSHFANIQGTTTIGGFGSTANTNNPIYLVKFESSLTLTSGPNMILPSNVDILTQSGDHAFIEYLGSGAWTVFSYQRKTGAAVKPVALNDLASTLSPFLLPTGVILPFASSTIPTGFLDCDGSAVNRTTYAGLFGVIGTTWGAGDGSTTFNLPLGDGSTLRAIARTPAVGSGLPNINGSGTASTNQATFTGHGFKNSARVKLVSGSLTGLTVGNDYFVIVINANTLSFSSTLINAVGLRTPITISGANTAVLQEWFDADADSRRAVFSGGATTGVGSYQTDQYMAHDNVLRSTNVGVTAGGTQIPFDNGAGTINNAVIPNGGNETRGRNMGVKFIIKT